MWHGLRILIVALNLTSCISVSRHQLAPLDASLQATPTVKKIRVFSRWSTESTSLSENQKEVLAELYLEHFEAALERRGCCEIVDSKDEADIILRAKAQAESKWSVLIPALITGLTLYIIPSWATEEFQISASVEVGHQIHQHAWQDAATLIQWLPLLFAMPFTDTALAGSEKLTHRVFDHIVADMLNDLDAGKKALSRLP